MNKQSGIHFLREQTEEDASGLLPTEILRIRDTVVAGLGDLLQGAFDAVDDSLFELANNSRSNNEQNRYFEAMREIRIKRKGVERHFQIAVAKLFASSPQAAAGALEDPAAASTDSLALVADDDLEEQVALSAMISKSKVHFQGPLLQLQARFSVIYPHQSGQAPVNPMAPEHLCNAFVEATQALEIQIRERLILLKQFDRYVVSNLGMLLDEANRILVQAGVIPDFRYHGKTERQQQKTDAVTAGAEEPERAEGEAIAADSQGHHDGTMFEQISQMLASQRAQAGHLPRAADPKVQVIGGAELINLLSALPQHSSEISNWSNLSEGEPSVVDLQSLVQRLLTQVDRVEAGKKPALNETDEDLINLVAMLFEFILDDYNLTAPVQVLISRLQIPILKVVLKDRTFFSKATHPARRLLNSLARAGIGWSDSDEKTRDKLYDQIHATVARILNQFDGDLSLFEALNDEFERFLARENRKSSLVEQRTRESERGRIKSQKAQETVDQLLQSRLARHKLQEPVRNILLNGWSRVMFLAYLRDNFEHRWTQSVRVVDDLIWCLHPHQEDEKRDQWVRVVPGLLKSLRAGLEEVSYNSSKLDEMMSELKHELTQAFRANALVEAMADSLEPEVAATAEPMSSKTAIELQQELEDAAIAEYIVQINEVQIGNWVEFNLINGASFRCKLSAIIEEAECFVFVNRMGMKVIEKTRSELAHELRRGRLTVLEQGGLIDRALDAVAGSLRSKAG